MLTLLKSIGCLYWQFFAAIMLFQALSITRLSASVENTVITQLYSTVSISAENKQAVKSLKKVHITLKFQNVSGAEVFRKIEEATGFSFSYNISDLEGKKVSGNYIHQTLFDILTDLCRQLNLKFRQYDEVINIKIKEETEKADNAEIHKVIR